MFNALPKGAGALASANAAEDATSRRAEVLAIWKGPMCHARLAMTSAHPFAASDRKVIWSNNAATLFIGSAGYLSLRKDVLDFASVSEGLRFDRGLKRASLNTIACSMGDEGDGPKAVACITRLDVDGELLFGIELRSMIPRHLAVDMVRALYPLTATEVQIVAHFLQGLTVDEMAKKGTGSVETVRTHVRNIYTKLGVTSREAMFAKMTPFLEQG